MKRLITLIIAGMFSMGLAVAGGDKEKVNFSELDKDGDGQLSRTEVAQNSELAAQFSTIDADGDGYVAEEELQNAEFEEAAAEDDQEDMGEDY